MTEKLKSITENVVTSLAIGFFAAVFGAYISQAKQEIKMEQIASVMIEIKTELKRIPDLETRIAILEYESNKGVN